MKPALFDFNGAAVRVIHNESGIWFVASDVASVLEIANVRQNLAAFPEDELGVCTTYTSVGERTSATVSESGLYRLIFQSRKPSAEAFKKWVLSEVLPAIRQTGAYALPGQIATNRVPQNFVEALRLAADAEEQRAALQLQLEEAAPKLATFERCMDSTSLFSFREVAAVFAEKGLGSNNLVTRLLSERILYRDTKGKILAYRQYIEAGYFKAVERPYEVKETGGTSTGETRISVTIKTTAKGIDFIGRKLSLTKLEMEAVA